MKVDRRVREKGGVLSVLAVSGGVNIGSVLRKSSFSSCSFFHDFQKGDSYSKNDRLTPPVYAATDVFFLRSSIRSAISLPVCLWLAKVGPEFGKNSKTENFFFPAVLVSRGEVSDVSRNIANSALSKGGLGAKRELKR